MRKLKIIISAVIVCCLFTPMSVYATGQKEVSNKPLEIHSIHSSFVKMIEKEEEAKQKHSTNNKKPVKKRAKVIRAKAPNVRSCPKRYEDFRCITARNTLNYKLTRRSHTSSNGIRKINSYYLVAIGQGWGYKVGDKLVISLSTGQKIKCIFADEKARCDTSGNDTYVSEGNGRKSYLEFIVSTRNLPRMARTMGDISYIEGFGGYFKSIKKIGVVQERR